MANTKNVPQYDNMWTNLKLDKLRGNKIFKGLWRGARVAAVGAIVAVADNIILVLTGFELIPMELITVIAPVAEKLLREYVASTKF